MGMLTIEMNVRSRLYAYTVKIRIYAHRLRHHTLPSVYHADDKIGFPMLPPLVTSSSVSSNPVDTKASEYSWYRV